MQLSISPSPLVEQRTDAIVVFFQETRSLISAEHSVLKDLCSDLVKTSSFKGEAGQVAVFPTAGKITADRVIVAGIGNAKHYHNGVLEQAAAAAVKAGKEAGANSFALASSIDLDGIANTDYQLLVGRGAAWGTYAFSHFKSEAKKSDKPTLVFVGDVEDTAHVEYAEAQGIALLDTADLANLPGNEATPEKIAQWAKRMAKTNGLSCQVMGKAELKKRGCGAMLSVADGSTHEARMIVLRHEGGEHNSKPIVLVGKTVTFDTGGISLKPGKNMGWMRYDKCGGMAVLTAMQMIARMKLNIPVVGILGAVENMPGSKATRPGDIVKASNGKTIEVLNTDAEGRLVLADALGLAAEMNPRAIVDLATLTGAVIIALGHSAAAVLGNDDELVQQLIDSGARAGERLWQLPLYKDYTDDMKSDFADLSNLCKSGTAGTATAAAFLQEFVPEGIPWAHLDIAGTAWLESAKPHQSPGATLFGARLLTQWVASQS